MHTKTMNDLNFIDGTIEDIKDFGNYSVITLNGEKYSYWHTKTDGTPTKVAETIASQHLTTGAGVKLGYAVNGKYKNAKTIQKNIKIPPVVNDDLVLRPLNVSPSDILTRIKKLENDVAALKIMQIDMGKEKALNFHIDTPEFRPKI